MASSKVRGISFLASGKWKEGTIKIAEFHVEHRTRDLRDIKQEYQPLNNDLRLECGMSYSTEICLY
jgi:hypothetical protein